MHFLYHEPKSLVHDVLISTRMAIFSKIPSHRGNHEFRILPFFAVERTFREEKRATHTASHAVIPAGHGNIDEMRVAIVMGALLKCEILY